MDMLSSINCMHYVCMILNLLFYVSTILNASSLSSQLSDIEIVTKNNYIRWKWNVEIAPSQWKCQKKFRCHRRENKAEMGDLMDKLMNMWWWYKWS